MNIEAKFMGFKIKSPIVVGSCGLTSDIEQLKKIEASGAGAIILKSLFEEQIIQEMNTNTKIYDVSFNGYPEAYEYIAENTKEKNLDKYINLIKEAKASLSIPIIASINCISASEWLSFVKKIDLAGADGVELNMFIMPSDVTLTTDDIERIYEETVHIIKKVTTLPLSLKISPYFTSITHFVQKISWMNIANLNIFNRFCQFDINMETMEIEPTEKLSTPHEFYNTLRWTSIFSSVAHCGITAGGGVHKSEDVIKLILAGAETVQVVSAIYNQGFEFIEKTNNTIKEWMEKNNYSSLSDFRGKMSVSKNKKAAAFQRIQYMKYYSEI